MTINNSVSNGIIRAHFQGLPVQKIIKLFSTTSTAVLIVLQKEYRSAA
jgi:hypothetical protein